MIDRLRIGKRLSNIRSQNNRIGPRFILLGIPSANASGKVVLWEQCRFFANAIGSLHKISFLPQLQSER